MKKILLMLLGLVPTLVAGQTERFKPVFTNMTELGASFGQVRYGIQAAESVSKRVNLTAQSFNGIQLRPRLAIGSTIGVDWYNSALLIPVCAGVRYDLARPGQKNLRVFSSFDTGWGFTWLNEDPSGYKTTGGWVISPGIGFRVGKPTSANFIMSLSYKRQEAEADKPLFWNELAKHETRVYNRMTVRLGISF
ncbi:hypothetical protein G8759_01690 [Spirosoma aureum]|uniref:Outer membrane protein beta-barrel domain-containing protein n=1 Tax=Spirosoma aureum TaxID=2692134 RepID=A0A6G9AGK3_9BACT|nr:hypothetical protein [Spirosoma aureum]QIP11439.1 hypothetical protein G8759_01690 [Spirosoma aureum]